MHSMFQSQFNILHRVKSKMVLLQQEVMRLSRLVLYSIPQIRHSSSLQQREVNPFDFVDHWQVAQPHH